MDRLLGNDNLGCRAFCQEVLVTPMTEPQARISKVADALLALFACRQICRFTNRDGTLKIRLRFADGEMLLTA